MIRVSGLHDQLAQAEAERSPDGLTPRQQLARIREVVRRTAQGRDGAAGAAAASRAGRARHPPSRLEGPGDGRPGAGEDILPRIGVPGAHPAGGGPGPPLPLHLQPLAVAGGRGGAIRSPASAGSRGSRSRRSSRASCPSDRMQRVDRRSRARRVPPARGADLGEPRPALSRDADPRHVPVPDHPGHGHGDHRGGSARSPGHRRPGDPPAEVRRGGAPGGAPGHAAADARVPARQAGDRRGRPLRGVRRARRVGPDGRHPAPPCRPARHPRSCRASTGARRVGGPVRGRAPGRHPAPPSLRLVPAGARTTSGARPRTRRSWRSR